MCLFQGVRPFVELAAVTVVVSSLDYEDSLEGGSDCFASYPRTTSLRFKPVVATPVNGKQHPGVGSASSRFSFTVSNLNSVKPWYLSTSTAPLGHSSRTVVPAESSPSLIGVSPLNARSYSFASPGARYGHMFYNNCELYIHRFIVKYFSIYKMIIQFLHTNKLF